MTRSQEHSARVAIEAEAVARYAAAVGETHARYRSGEIAPPMFAAVYAAPAVWPAVLAVAGGRGPMLHFAQRFDWGAPVHCGDVITTVAGLRESARRAGSSFFTFESRSQNQRDAEVSCGRWTIMIPGAA